MKKLLWTLSTATGTLIALFVWANAPAPALSNKITKIVVVKSKHRLYLLNGGETIASFGVALGRGGAGPKQRQGDGRTPEGIYTIDSHNQKSAFYRALHISYPNSRDLATARALGAPAGGDVMIHGLPPKATWLGRLQCWVDWTNGCVALSDPEMQQVYTAVSDGTPVELRP